jgi:hypothetical protein
MAGLTRNQKYYAKKKKDPAFMEARRQRAAAFRATPAGKGYHRNYGRQYYKDNKNRIDEYRKTLPDPTRNARSRKYWALQKENLTKPYIVKLLTRHSGLTINEITSYMVVKKRKEIIAFRERKKNRKV